MKNRINVIVPVYADVTSLKRCLFSLKKYYGNKQWLDVYFVNDNGPEAEQIETLTKDLIRHTKNFYYHRNDKNLGFIKSVNNTVFHVVKDKKADILLLNSDTEVKPPAIETMKEVLASDKTIGAVNPRTNNATMYGGHTHIVSISVPLDGRLRMRPALSYNLFKRQIGRTPEYIQTPVFSGFCVLIRRKIIDEIGLLDEIYGKGYFDDNDMSMRIYEHGYKTVASNRAFVVHFGSKSFSDHYRTHRSEVNKKIFFNKYPQFIDHIRNFPDSLVSIGDIHKRNIVKRLSGIGAKVFAHINTHGVRPTIKKSYKVLLKKAFNRTTRRKPMVQVWSHEITNTGAPIVLKSLLFEWKESSDFPDDVTYCFPVGARVDSAHFLELIEGGFPPNPVSEYEAEFVKGDVVFLNSALPYWVYDKVLAAMERGIVPRAFIYFHENSELLLMRHIDGLLGRFTRQLEDGDLIIYTPSMATTAGWKKKIGVSKNIYPMPGKVHSFDSRMFKEKSAKSFHKLNFFLSGSVMPHKGALSVVYALESFYHSFYKKNPQAYREFSLTILGMGHDEYLYNDFIRNAAKPLGKKIKLIPHSSDSKFIHDLTYKSNSTIMYSINETYSLVTMEGMSYGHPIIRSEVPGLEEQLNNNGWLASTTDWWGLVMAIEEALNTSKTSNDKLKRMSDQSIEIAKKAYYEPYRFIKDFQEQQKR